MAYTIGLKRAFWIILALVGIYPGLLLLLTVPFIQRQYVSISFCDLKILWKQMTHTPKCPLR